MKIGAKSRGEAAEFWWENEFFWGMVVSNGMFLEGRGGNVGEMGKKVVGGKKVGENCELGDEKV